jgi:UDP-N-acetylmuramoyl-tripeptide--D-alanyl-D-alanine ligase
VIAVDLDTVARVTGGSVHGDGAVRPAAIATDSRHVPDGDALFVALRGEHGADGHDHLAAARAAGAVAALVDHRPDGDDGPTVVVPDVWRALRDLAGHVRRTVAPRTVAITGSVGKTTVKDLTAAAIGAGHRVTAARGSFNNELGVPLTLLSCTAATEVLVAEIGARHVGDIADLAPLVAPDIAVVTAVAGVHLEVFGTIDDVARAKAELVEALGPDGTAVLNTSDPRVAAMAGRAPAVVTVGGDGADVTATDVRLDRAATPTFTAHTPWGDTEVHVPLAGRHQVGNALLALAVAGRLGVDLDAAAAAIADAAVSPWRGEVTHVGGLTVLNDAYNANPTSVIAALDTLTALTPEGGRPVAVLGVMAEIGPTHDAEHARVGAAAAAAGVAHLVVVGSDAVPIAAGARDAGLTAEAITVVPDRATALTHLAATLRDGDVVLVKASRVAQLERLAADLTSGELRVGGGAGR